MNAYTPNVCKDARSRNKMKDDVVTPANGKHAIHIFYDVISIVIITLLQA